MRVFCLIDGRESASDTQHNQGNTPSLCILHEKGSCSPAHLTPARCVQEPIADAVNQTSFYFEVNGLPIFAKGSNAIPMDVVPSRGRSPAALRRLVRDAADSHQNMLRVWGGACPCFLTSDFICHVVCEPKAIS